MATFTPPTVEYAFEPLLTTLATGTTLAAATRHDFAAVTVSLPMTSMTFKSVVVEVTARYAGAAAVRTPNGWRIGIKLGAVAFDDLDFTPTAIAATGQIYALRYTRDVTDYFTTNWSGSSMAAQVGVAFSTATDAQAMNNITAKLLITYTADDASATYIKTVRIPIQSEHTTLTAVSTEIGTGGTNPAAANQIPALDTFLPETSKTIRRAWIEIVGQDGRTTVTDFNLNVEIDATGPSARATLEAAFTGGAVFKDMFIYDTATYSTASAHAFKLSSSTTTRFPCIGAVLYVTYEYDPASTTHLQSLMIPIDCHAFGQTVMGTTTAEQDALMFELWVEEPATVTLVQSGLLLWFTSAAAGCAMVIHANGQAERTYTIPSIGNGTPGALTLVHRADHGASPWSLARGKNELTWYVYTTTARTASMLGGFAIVNYTSGLATDGCARHNASCAWSRFDYQTSGAVTAEREVATTDQVYPDFSRTNWWLNSIGTEILETTSGTAFANWNAGLKEEILGGELAGDGWLTSEHMVFWPDSDLGCFDQTLDLTHSFNQNDQETGKMVHSASRKARTPTPLTNQGMYSAARWWTTHHCITYDSSGTVSGYPSGDGSAISVEIVDRGTGKVVMTTTTVAGGAFTAHRYDNVGAHYARARHSATAVGSSDDN